MAPLVGLEGTGQFEKAPILGVFNQKSLKISRF